MQGRDCFLNTFSLFGGVNRKDFEFDPDIITSLLNYHLKKSKENIRSVLLFFLVHSAFVNSFGHLYETGHKSQEKRKEI